MSKVDDDQPFLEDLLGKTVFFTGIYAITNSIFRQAYLHYYGLKFEFLNLEQGILPKTNFIILCYSLFIWIVLINTPNTWYERLSDLMRPHKWQKEVVGTVLGSAVALLFVTVTIFYIEYSLEYLISLITTSHGLQPLSSYSLTSHFSHLATCFFYLLVGVAYATAAKKLKLVSPDPDQVRRERISLSSSFYRYGPPFLLVYFFLVAGIIVPSAYANLKARRDIVQMWGTNLLVVNFVSVSEDTCLPESTQLQNAESIVQPDIHYLGEHQGFATFIWFPFKPIREEKLLSGFSNLINQEFETCLVSYDQINSMSVENE